MDTESHISSLYAIFIVTFSSLFLVFICFNLDNNNLNDRIDSLNQSITDNTRLNTVNGEVYVPKKTELITISLDEYNNMHKLITICSETFRVKQK
jgi:hypothetical protein